MYVLNALCCKQKLLPFWQAKQLGCGGAESFWWSSILVINYFPGHFDFL
jgi:hypothetical protein